MRKFVRTLPQILDKGWQKRALCSKIPRIAYASTDEAPALAACSLLPIIKRFTKPYGVVVDCYDISLAARILALWPERLKADQKQVNTLAELSTLVKLHQVSVIMTLNINATSTELNEAIAELQMHGFDVPNNPLVPSSKTEEFIKDRYASVLGAAVDNVLHPRNSHDLTSPQLEERSSDSKTHIVSMPDGDFQASERSHMLSSRTRVRIELASKDRSSVELRKEVALVPGDIITGAVASRGELRAFLERECVDALARHRYYYLIIIIRRRRRDELLLLNATNYYY